MKTRWCQATQLLRESEFTRMEEKRRINKLPACMRAGDELDRDMADGFSWAG